MTKIAEFGSLGCDNGGAVGTRVGSLLGNCSELDINVGCGTGTIEEMRVSTTIVIELESTVIL